VSLLSVVMCSLVSQIGLWQPELGSWHCCFHLQRSVKTWQAPSVARKDKDDESSVESSDNDEDNFDDRLTGKWLRKRISSYFVYPVRYVSITVIIWFVLICMLRISAYYALRYNVIGSHIFPHY